MVDDRNSSKLNLSIKRLLEVEEHVWSPMYGLKGNIDATVQVACRDGDNEKTLVVPLELKTGRRDTNQAHRAQTALYTLLMSDRYGKSSSLNNSAAPCLEDHTDTFQMSMSHSDFSTTLS